ncbi:15604_t:CDS:2, partial [Acaulospora colombiana]
IGGDAGDSELQKVHITVRITRSPVVGDNESGIQPDVIINPHAFPSRMTIGMFVESMAGKAGAMHGLAQDATPFEFSEDDTAIDYFGKQLLAAGYNYYGNEPMYSGITGEEFAADIYLGVVYYQRLRHMVSDKFQVRSTCPVDPTTRQPVKGRKRAGGIRFGEMERDALIAHGTSFLLQDRLMNCSDYSTAWVCRSCGSLISLGYEDITIGGLALDSGEPSSDFASGPSGEYCR